MQRFTGHLVFSTLHTNNAAGTFPRLIDLGVNSCYYVGNQYCHGPTTRSQAL